MRSHNGVYVYSVGPLSLSACAPKDMPIDEVTAAVNIAHPTGIGPWAWAKDEDFSSGEPNPNVCEISSDKLHYLFHC